MVRLLFFCVLLTSHFFMQSAEREPLELNTNISRGADVFLSLTTLFSGGAVFAGHIMNQPLLSITGSLVTITTSTILTVKKTIECCQVPNEFESEELIYNDNDL